MKRHKIIFIVLCALVSSVWPGAGLGRSSSRAPDTRASKISGIVLDANQSRIVGATIRIENARFSRVLRSGDQGDFEVELPAGVYRLIVEMNGFKRYVLRAVNVRAGARASVSIRMEVQPPAMPLRIE
jgi:hypothetical protein